MEISKENIINIVSYINNQPDKVVQGITTNNNKFRYKDIVENRVITELNTISSQINQSKSYHQTLTI